MKLLTKLTIFITGSKMLIVFLFVMLLPVLVSRVSFQYTNYYLEDQKKKVMAVIEKNGVGYYLQGDSSYGSYTMLKEEYISLFPAGNEILPDTIETTRRVIEEDTLNYRVITHAFVREKQRYLLEIGKTTATIGAYNNLLQRFTLYALTVLIALSILIDLLYTHILLRPLTRIVRTKLLDRKFPFRESLVPVKTSTADFKFLDTSLISLMETIHAAFEKEREFTSNASHELMTPISILQSNVENMLVGEGLSEAQQEKVLAMMKTLNRLKKIIHSLLYISRIENEQFAKTDHVNLHALIEEVMEELAHRLETKSLRFRNGVAANVRFKMVNRDLLFQLFYNLINNAIRYNKENGMISVTSHFTAGEPYLTMIVRDSGIGIRQEDLGSIFDRFKKSGHTEGEGYGIGLSIVKSIVLYHDAKIMVQSEFGKGTDIVIQFPVERLFV
ncbi:MAG: HAMP domain-containing sensor histidine kinase [Chitinophagaceae bacterium]